MIQQVAAFQVGQQVFPTIKEAQREELRKLLSDGGEHTETALAVIDSVIKHSDEVVAILTCKPTTKKPRSDKGTKRKPKAAPVGEAAAK